MLNTRQRWAIVSGVAGALAVGLAERAITTSWRLAKRQDPPSDPADKGVSWQSAVAWTMAAGAIAGLSQLIARQGAELAWKRVTGRKPPRSARRKRRAA